MYYNLDYTNETDMSVINYTFPKKAAGGSYISKCYYQNENGSNVPILVETPQFSFKDIHINKNKPYIEIFLNEETEPFFEFVNNLRDYNINYASKQSSIWFSKEMSSKFLEEYHIDMIQNIDENPKINLCLPVSNENINLDITDYNNKPLDIHELNNRKVKCIVNIETIKFLKKDLYCNLNVVKIQAQKESFLELINPNNTDNLEIEKYDHSTINFSNNEEITDEEEVDVNQEDLYIENDENDDENYENNDQNIDENNLEHNDEKISENEIKEEEDDNNESLEMSLENMKLEELTPMNIENLENIDTIDIDDYNNFIYEDDENTSNDDNKTQNDILEKEIQDCDTIIKEAENEYNKKLQLLNEQEQLLISKKNQIEELKKKKNNNEKHLNL